MHPLLALRNGRHSSLKFKIASLNPFLGLLILATRQLSTMSLNILIRSKISAGSPTFFGSSMRELNLWGSCAPCQSFLRPSIASLQISTGRWSSQARSTRVWYHKSSKWFGHCRFNSYPIPWRDERFGVDYINHRVYQTISGIGTLQWWHLTKPSMSLGKFP